MIIVSARRPAAVATVPRCSRFMSAVDMPSRASEPTSRNVVDPSALGAGRSVRPANALTRAIFFTDHCSTV